MYKYMCKVGLHIHEEDHSQLVCKSKVAYSKTHYNFPQGLTGCIESIFSYNDRSYCANASKPSVLQFML